MAIIHFEKGTDNAIIPQMARPSVTLPNISSSGSTPVVQSLSNHNLL